MPNEQSSKNAEIDPETGLERQSGAAQSPKADILGSVPPPVQVGASRAAPVSQNLEPGSLSNPAPSLEPSSEPSPATAPASTSAPPPSETDEVFAEIGLLAVKGDEKPVNEAVEEVGPIEPLPASDPPLERDQEKGMPVHRSETRPNKELEPGFDSIKTETALEPSPPPPPPSRPVQASRHAPLLAIAALSVAGLALVAVIVVGVIASQQLSAMSAQLASLTASIDRNGSLQASGLFLAVPEQSWKGGEAQRFVAAASDASLAPANSAAAGVPASAPAAEIAPAPEAAGTPNVMDWLDRRFSSNSDPVASVAPTSSAPDNQEGAGPVGKTVAVVAPIIPRPASERPGAALSVDGAIPVLTGATDEPRAGINGPTASDAVGTQAADQTGSAAGTGNAAPIKLAECIPQGTGFTVGAKDAYPVCGIKDKVGVAEVQDGRVLLTNGALIPAGGKGPLAGTRCQVALISAAYGFAQIKVECP